MTQRNIVLVTYDSLRADHCGHLGYERDTTPTLDRLAEAGTSFTDAIAPASRTNPSMAGIFTGEPMIVRDQVSTPALSRRHLARYGTLAEELAERGYATGAFNPNAYASRYYGFDRGFDHFEDFLFSTDRYQRVFRHHLTDSSLYTIVRNFRNYLRREEAFKTWDRYIDDVVAWVEAQPEPFFLWIFSLDTHFPHLTPRQYRQWSSLFEQYYYNWRCNRLIDDLDPDLSDAVIRKIVDIYDDSIRFGDVLLAELRDRLAAFDPVYVVFGDHGEAFGERGIYGHFYPSLYEESIHVPLVVSEPVDGFDDRSDPISLTRVGDIVKQFAGIDADARSADWVVATDYDGRNDRNLVAIRAGDAKQIVCREHGSLTLEATFDLPDDPSEAEPLPTESPVHKSLNHLTRRRFAHEDELLAIRSAVETLG